MVQISATVGYLPPERSQYGRDMQSFFDHLLQIVYRSEDCELIVMGGDFNGRIGSNLDFIPEVDTIGGRKPLDLLSNSHGEALIEFLKESKQCVLNGRITPHLDNYASVSGRGKAVVDYLITNHTCIEQFTHCEVYPVRELCDKINYKPANKLPDHSIVVSEFKCFHGFLKLKKILVSMKDHHGCVKRIFLKIS